MMRNDSTSVISSLQMDYGDSDEEESDPKNASRHNLEDVQSSESIIVKVTETTIVVKPDPDPALEDSQPMVQDSQDGSPIKEEDSIKVETEIDTTETEDIINIKKEPEISPAELISDDEDGDHSHSHQRTHSHKHHSSHSHKDADRKQTVAEAVNTDSPSSQGSLKTGRKATRLVSYGPDEDLDEDETSSEEEEEQEQSASSSPEVNMVESTIISHVAGDDIKIPPEPSGKCSYEIQKKIDSMYERMRREGFDLNRVIQSKKNFRNPSIYDKLIEFCHIDEKGTNFPPEIYDPHIWGKESFYDELDKAQRKDMERREKEKKERTKIEFLTGTKKPAPPPDGSAGVPDEKKRKSKWDAQPMNIQVSKLPSAHQNPGVVNLTAIATGTKATVISAVGSLSKKPSTTGK